MTAPDWLKVYGDLYAGGRYGTGTARLQEAFEATREWRKGSLLDVSCGRGWYIEQMAKAGFTVTGTEMVPALCDGKRVREATIDKLPFPDEEFAYVTCWDVLEHIAPPGAAAGLREMRRVAREGAAVSVNNRHPSKWGAKAGTELHINIKTYEQWEELIRDVFEGWEVTSFYENRSPIFVCDRP